MKNTGQWEVVDVLAKDDSGESESDESEDSDAASVPKSRGPWQPLYCAKLI